MHTSIPHFFVDPASVRDSHDHFEIVAIREPEDGKLRARKVVTRSRARSTRKYPSWKMGRMIQWESIHERNAFVLLDADPNVKRFREQPLVIEYTLNGKPHRHFPDLLVVYGNAKHLWEIKSREAALSDETKLRTALLSHALSRYGFQYRLILGESLEQKSFLSNAELLNRFGRHPISFIQREKARRVFFDRTGVTWGEIISGTLGMDGRQIVCRLILEGTLMFEFGLPLQSDTIIRVASSEIDLSRGGE